MERLKPLIHPFILFTILISAKLLFVRSVLLADSSIFSAIWVELPVVLMITLSLEMLFQSRQRLRFALYMTLNTLLSLIFFALMVYYQYFGAIATYTSLFSLNQTGEVGDSIASLIQPSFWLLFLDLPILLVCAMWLRRSSFLWSGSSLKLRNRYGGGLLVAFTLWALWNTLNSIGGGVLNEMKKAEGMGLLTYQAYVVYADAKRDYMPTAAVTPQAIRALKQLPTLQAPLYFGEAKGTDVVVVQLESFQDFLLDLEIDGQEVTPTMNELARDGFYFDRFFQQIGKGNTSDAEFVANTSLYPTGVKSMSQSVAGRKVPSIPRLLEEEGYRSVTLHTNDAKFWDRNEMYPALGFDQYYDKAYFGEEDVIAFGASDEVLYEGSLEVIKELKAGGHPVYASVVAMSSHNPFELPPGKVKLKLPAELEGTFLGNYLQSCHYADYALGKLVEEMKAQGLWDNTLLAVYGDHFGFHDSTPEHEQELAAELIGIPSYTKAEMFNVPLVLRVPEVTGETLHHVSGQIDLLPTLANLLGIDISERIVFGQDLLNYTDNLIAQRVYLPSGSFINEEAMVIPGQSLEDAIVLPLDPMAEPKPGEAYRDDYNRALRMLQMSDSYVNALPTTGAEN